MRFFTLILSFTLPYASRGREKHRSARDDDCNVLLPTCLDALNGSSAATQIPTSDVLDAVEKFGQDHLHDGAISADNWMDSFRTNFCQTWTQESFPITEKAVDQLRKRLENSASENGVGTILVHADRMVDGIGARIKKGAEFAAASISLGFAGVALSFPPAGSLVHPRSDVWKYGPVWCHESSADGPDPPKRSPPDYPLVCWQLDVHADIFAQRSDVAGRTPLWGALPLVQEMMEKKIQKFQCAHFGMSTEPVPADNAWKLLRRKDTRDGGVHRQHFSRTVESVRRFSMIQSVFPGRQEILCGYGEADIVHVGMHVRMGDVSEASGYSVPQQLSAIDLSRWLCDLSNVVDRKIMLHIFTESVGRSRSALRRSARRGATPGFKFPKREGDKSEPIFHTFGELQVKPQCGDRVMRNVHFIVNNNPRDALLCMSRADILVTSFSSLVWVSSLLNEGLVFHPDSKHYPRTDGNPTHWDLRDQYFDWATNWFRVSDVWHRGKDVKFAFDSSARTNRLSEEL